MNDRARHSTPSGQGPAGASLVGFVSGAVLALLALGGWLILKLIGVNLPARGGGRGLLFVGVVVGALALVALIVLAWLFMGCARAISRQARKFAKRDGGVSRGSSRRSRR